MKKNRTVEDEIADGLARAMGILHLCDSCTKADVSCPIFNSCPRNERTTECIEYQGKEQLIK